MLADMEERRFIKSHLPLSLLPRRLLDTAKVVYVARNPKAGLENLLKVLKDKLLVGSL